MWGICQDVAVCDGRLCDRVIEYREGENGHAVVIEPVSGIEIAMQNILPLASPPRFRYGDTAAPRSHPEKQGIIRDIVWHYQKGACLYYLQIDSRNISKRYPEEELSEV